MPARPARPPKGRETDPFDLWLRQSLHEGHDDIVHAPVPEDLLRLVSDSRQEWEVLRARWLPPKTEG